LKVKINAPNRILESDLLATFLLGIVATIDPNPSRPVSSYAKGCELVMMNCFQNSGGHAALNDLLLTFSPLILDWLEVWHLQNSNQWRTIYRLRRHLFDGECSFEQRQRYFQPENEWRSTRGWAIQFSLSVWTEKLLYVVQKCAARENDLNQHERGDVETVLESVKSDLKGPRFNEAFEASKLWQEDVPTR